MFSRIPTSDEVGMRENLMLTWSFKESLCKLLPMQPATKFTVGLVQMAVTADPDQNIQRAASFVEQAAGLGAQVICLPELFRSQYFCQREDAALFDLAETVPGPSTEAIGRIAREKKVTVIAPVFERRAAGLYHNSAAIIDAEGKVSGIYRKMHIPDDPAYYEKFYFTPGDLGFRAFDTEVGKIGTLICWYRRLSAPVVTLLDGRDGIGS